MSLPTPEPGLVIRYAYLWLREHRSGREEGAKDRPCTIVVATENRRGITEVLVVPVTHSQPPDESAALEIPAAIKRSLGLDSQRSWVVLSESNRFDWPGPDLRRVGGSMAFGVLPPRFFEELRRRFLALELAARSSRVSRTE